MRLESASKSVAEISGDTAVQKLGKYSYRNIRQKTDPSKQKSSGTDCYFCGMHVTSSISKHVQQCPAKKVKCRNCNKTGHLRKYVEIKK